jgi:hypothetical protein
MEELSFVDLTKNRRPDFDLLWKVLRREKMECVAFICKLRGRAGRWYVSAGA